MSAVNVVSDVGAVCGDEQIPCTEEGCPYCGAQPHRVVVTGGPHIIACLGCGLYRPKPRMDRVAQITYLKRLETRLDVTHYAPPSDGLDQLTWELKLLKRYVPSVFSGGRVLDVGCAEGTFVMGLQKAGAKAVGLEPLDGLASLARSYGLDVRTARFETDGLSPDLLEKPFDLICFRESWYYLPDLRESFALLRHLLAPGGWVYLKATQGRSLYFRLWPDRFLVRYGPSVSGIPTASAIRYLFTCQGFQMRYLADFPSATLRLLGFPHNRFTGLLNRSLDPWCRPLLRALSMHDRLVAIASYAGKSHHD